MRTIQRDKRLDHLVDLLAKYAHVDFSEKAPITTNSDEVDALAAGLNIMTEELQTLIRNERWHIEEIKRLNAALEQKIEARTVELEKSEKIFRIMIEKNEEMIALTRPGGKFLYASPSFTSILGFEKGEYSNRSVFEFIHPDDYSGLAKQTMNIINTPEKSFYSQQRLLHKDGTYRWYEGTVTNMLHDPDIGALISNFRDITERKKSEEQVKKILQRLKQAQEAAHVGSWELDFITGTSIWSDEACKMYGIPKEENLQSFETWISYIHPEDLDAVKKEIERSQATLSDSSFEHRILLRDGTVRNIHSVSKFEFNESGEPIGLVGICHDITERKKSEKKLRKSEANLTAIIENTDALIYSLDVDFRYLTFNNVLKTTMKSIYGLDIKQGDKVFDFLKKIEPKEAKWWENIYSQALKGEGLQFIKEYNINDSLSFSSFSINPIWENGNVIGLSCFVRDITQQKLSEEKLFKSEIEIRNFAKHLNYIQEEERAHIAREIHDELGQQLVGIKIGLSQLSKQKNQKDGIRAIVKETDNAIQSMRRIATDLRPGILDSLGLIPSIRWLGSEFEKKTGIKCQMEIRTKEQWFGKNISTCFFRICQETLTNILKHAEASKVIINVSYTSGLLALKIADNGKGMASEKLENPFSMGLLGMRERANIIGADLQILSKKNAGTTVQLNVKID